MPTNLFEDLLTPELFNGCCSSCECCWCWSSKRPVSNSGSIWNLCIEELASNTVAALAAAEPAAVAGVWEVVVTLVVGVLEV